MTTITQYGDGNFATVNAMPTGKPLAPTGLKTAIGDRQIIVSWAAPATTVQTGGSRILDYRVEYSADRGRTWTVFPDGISAATSATLTGLANGTAYLVRVAALNANGRGPYATASAVVPQALPGAPTRLTGRAGNGIVDLVWTAPSLAAGTTIVDYVIEYSTNGGANWTRYDDGISAATTARVAVPTNGIPYVFRVAAAINGGMGAFSAPSPTVTPFSPLAVPAAPTAPAVRKVASGSVQLTWVAPPANAGGAVNGYVIQYRLQTSTTWTSVTVSSTAQLATIAKLTTGRAYVFRVAARNLAGIGQFSSQVTALA